MTTSVTDLFAGGSKVFAAFDKTSPIGAQITGTIVSVDLWDVRDIRTNEVKTWDDGRPQKQLRIVLQADHGQWTPQDEDDTGERALYVKSWGDHFKPLREAVQAAGAKQTEKGGRLAARFVSEKENGPGLNATKIYAYQYQPPAGEVAGLFGGETVNHATGEITSPAPAAQPPVAAPTAAPVAPAAPVPAAQPAPSAQPPAAAAPQQDPWGGQPAAPAAPQPAAPPAQPGPMDQALQLLRAGIPDATIAATVGVTDAQLAALRQQHGLG